MRYEQRRFLTALLSLVSIAGLSGVAVAYYGDLLGSGMTGLDTVTIITVAAAVPAAMSAYLSIIWNRRLQHARSKQRLFLLYAREDLDSVRMVAEDLKEKGFNPWLDVDELVPGVVWREAVMNALEESTAALVFVSKNLVGKQGFVAEELKAAMRVLHEPKGRTSPIIPLRLDDAEVPEELAHIQWLDLGESGALDRLEAGLKRIAGEQPSAN